MRCIFCKKSSSDSKSVEHIIPESLWNTKNILPAGVVCDKCNNYFARKVEKPFLDSPALTQLRHFESIPNKLGHIPSLRGLLLSGHEAHVFKHSDAVYKQSIAVPPEAIEGILNGKITGLILPASGALPDPHIISRFLAKVAIEVLAERLMNVPGGLDYIIDEKQFDDIRTIARIGQSQKWLHHIRRIYPSDRHFTDIDGEHYQVVHEYDFLYTPKNELYFIMALFGIELAINMGGPEVDGYIEWIENNGGASPLYSGRNSVPKT